MPQYLNGFARYNGMPPYAIDVRIFSTSESTSVRYIVTATPRAIV
jgi:hypothetical protein